MADIEYFYSAHSLFAYFGSARLSEIARAAGRKITHRPMDLHKVMEAMGSTSFRARSKAHYTYFFGREKERWSEFRRHRSCRTGPNITTMTRRSPIAC